MEKTVQTPQPLPLRPLSEQFGQSLMADFEENTWTFKMEDEFKITAGRFKITPDLPTPQSPVSSPVQGVEVYIPISVEDGKWPSEFETVFILPFQVAAIFKDNHFWYKDAKIFPTHWLEKTTTAVGGYSRDDMEKAIDDFVVATHPGKSIKRSFNYSRDTLRQNLVDFIAALPQNKDNAVTLDVEKIKTKNDNK